MDDNQVEYLPFNALNEFMVNEYRLHVLQTVFANLNRLSGPRRNALNGIFRRYVQVPGFRNSGLAPAGVKARSSVTVFERNPDFVAQMLQGWSELNPELRQQVYEFLTAREWEVLPADADRTQLPGFLPEWPEGQDYDLLGQAFSEMYPDAKVDENDLRLMIVWLAGRLPYDMYGDDEEGEDMDEEDEEMEEGEGSADEASAG